MTKLERIIARVEEFYNTPEIKHLYGDFETFLQDEDCRSYITVSGRTMPVYKTNFLDYLQWLYEGEQIAALPLLENTDIEITEDADFTYV